MSDSQIDDEVEDEGRGFSSRWQQLGLLLFLLALCGAGLWLALRGDSGSEDEQQPGSEETTEQVAPVLPPSGEVEAEPAPSTLSPSELEQYDGTDVGKDFASIPVPGFEPTSDRKPQAGDEAAAKAVIRDVVPGWATLENTKSTSAASWEQAFRNEAGTTDEFVGYSLLAFDDVWGGLFQMDMSARDAKVTDMEELWNEGSHSLWRVEVQRRLVPNMEGAPGGRTETVSWDFLIEQTEEGSKLTAFVEPSKDNEDPDTFSVPQE